MPGIDGTGPLGNGPMTGRGMGRCNAQGTPVGYGRGFGRGMGNGRGRGSGRGYGNGRMNGTAVPYDPAQDVVDLKARAEMLECELAALRAQLSQMDLKPKTDE